MSLRRKWWEKGGRGSEDGGRFTSSSRHFQSLGNFRFFLLLFTASMIWVILLKL